MIGEERSAAFALFKPVCDNIVRGPTKANTTELTKLLQLQKVSRAILAELQEYILFPLDLHLKNPATKYETRQYLIDCIKEVLNYTSVDSLPKLFSLHSLIFHQIYNKDATGLVGDVSEELKCSVTQCASMLVKKAAHQVLFDLYDRRNVPKLSQGIYMCIHLASTERSREVRLSAIEYVATLAQVHECEHASGTVLHQRVGEFLMFLLPGIVGGFVKVMTADDKQSHQVTMMALRAWSRIIAVVLEDSNETSANNKEFLLNLNQQLMTPNSEDPNPLQSICRNQDREGMLDYLDSHQRTPEWIRSCAEKLAPLAERITTLQSHSHWLVRLELVASCNLLLSRCPKNLSPAVTQFVEILIMSTEDDMEQVATQSREALEAFTRICEEESSKSLLDILEENFFTLLTKLPRILHSTNETSQLSALRLLAGYIRTLGATKLPDVLNSSVHLHRLVVTLIHVVELDTSGVSLLEDYSLRDFSSNQITGLNGPWKQFRHFNDRSILNKTEEICRLLGQLGDIVVLSDYLLDTFHNSPQHQKEIVLLLNEIVCYSHSEASSESNLQIIKNVLDTYLEATTWYIPLTAGDDGLTIAEAHSNLILACLLVEGLGKMAATLGRSYDRFLLRTLYMVLERAGSTHGLLAAAGMTAIEQLARAGGHDGVTSLICANVDYFSYHVTMKLRRYEQNPGVLDVLDVVMKHSSIDVLPCIKDIVSDILLQSCDTFQEASALAFLRVFHTFVVCVQKWLVPAKSPNCFETPIQRDYKAELREYIEASLRSDKFDSTDFEDLPDEQLEDPAVADKDMEVDDTKKKSLPSHIAMTVSVLKRCLHFLPSSNKHQKLLVIATLQQGVGILAGWDDELLPVVHLIWSPLVGRFREDPLIVNRSFTLLCTLAKTARDFIRARTFKDVLPTLYKTLQSSASKSYKKDSGSAYRFTQEFKLQLMLLEHLGELVNDLGLQGKQLDDLMMAALPYLSHYQPMPLQEACVKLFHQLAVNDLWAVLAKMLCLKRPNSDGKIHTELQKNSQLIFDYCNRSGKRTECL